MLLKLLLISAFLISTAQAETSGGIAAYAGTSRLFPCARVSEMLADKPVRRVSILWHTFGRSFKCLNRWAGDAGLLTLESHLINEVCVRNHRCGDYEILAGLTPAKYEARLKAKDQKLINKIRTKVRKLGNWYNAHPAVRCLISPGLESNLSRAGFKVLRDSLTDIFPPWCRWVWNPVNRTATGPGPIEGTIYELHGEKPDLPASNCIANLDGVDIETPSRKALMTPFIPYNRARPFLERFSGCEAAFLWTAEMNGIKKGPFTDPRSRRNFPSKKLAKDLRAVLFP